MGFKQLLGGLFGGGESAPAEDAPVEYEGYTIAAAPMRQGGQWICAGVVRKGGREHAFIRADTFADRESAAELSVRKGKRLVDELGERMFDA